MQFICIWISYKFYIIITAIIYYFFYLIAYLFIYLFNVCVWAC